MNCSSMMVSKYYFLHAKLILLNEFHPDVNECENGMANCDINADCKDTDGGFTCKCRRGYEGNGVQCRDVNECTEKKDNCDAHAECTNTQGSFECSCNEGYRGNGVTCVG